MKWGWPGGKKAVFLHVRVNNSLGNGKVFLELNTSQISADTYLGFFFFIF